MRNNFKENLRTISLFSGIGGLDLGFIESGYKLIWANEMDKHAVQAYKANIDKNIIEGDILDLYKEIPENDVLLAGFPCQPFSMMGKQKGFEDERGTLFFTIQKIIELHQNKPKVIVLENVKNLLTHQKGQTFAKMKEILETLGYEVHSEVLDTKDYGLPQTRRRVFVVCFLKSFLEGSSTKFTFPEPKPLKLTMYDLLDEEVEKKYFLSEKILPTILSNGSGNYYSKSEIDLEIARPLTATMHKMHRASQDNYYTDNKNRSRFKDEINKPISNIRRITPNECRKLQGFPDKWKFVVSDTQSYRQFGNAVSVNVSRALALRIKEYIGMINNEKHS
ncbi:DNA cytosine methyltransferase [Macrococcus bovicus]|uniref:DNA cytosine methyltransferase n=1 Tax=Macrococcus bovicus TaxID=69968 RepID=UPI0025A598D5|nr:DNA cytosine methyltransferase [Macrococcus bovicus]WJP97273.1 DNA cytosine methyltransferase [Macrococcus bovicus]